MRILTSLLVAAFLFCLPAAPAEAQRRPTTPPPRTQPPARTVTPRSGTLAAGASIGLTSTRSQFLDNGLQLAGHVERYVTPQASVRAQLGAAWWDVTGLSYAGTMRPLFLLGNIVYSWPGDDWHPYATAGGGMYRYGFTEADVSGSKTKAGFDLGGGVEYFIGPDATITGEALFHRVGLVPTNRAALGFKGSFWSFAIGAKKYL
jgi:hypothetical protein